MIRLMDSLLKEDKLDLCLTPYSVLATSVSDGFVQFVRSIPLADLKGTIQVCVSSPDCDAISANLGHAASVSTFAIWPLQYRSGSAQQLRAILRRLLDHLLHFGDRRSSFAQPVAVRER